MCVSVLWLGGTQSLCRFEQTCCTPSQIVELSLVSPELLSSDLESPFT